MNVNYFSDEELGAKCRVEENIPQNVWEGIVAIVQSRIGDGSFGQRFPDTCNDSAAVCGSDAIKFAKAVEAEIPGIKWPPEREDYSNGLKLPATLYVLDFVQFCYSCIAKPLKREFHPFFRHHHLDFDEEAGRDDFRADINRIFARNSLAFVLQTNGRIERLAPSVLRESLSEGEFKTGDLELDRMLETARMKYLDPNPTVRREALEKLWDAWERVKTLETASDKKASIGKMLLRVSSEPSFRETLDTEGKELTRIGNAFQIRHSEVSQTPLQDDTHADYLFHRLFALIRLFLKQTGRA